MSESLVCLSWLTLNASLVVVAVVFIAILAMVLSLLACLSIYSRSSLSALLLWVDIWFGFTFPSQIALYDLAVVFAMVSQTLIIASATGRTAAAFHSTDPCVALLDFAAVFAMVSLAFAIAQTIGRTSSLFSPLILGESLVLDSQLPA